MPNLFGTEWKLESRKSIFTSGFSPNTETRKYDELENGYTLAVRGTEGGKPYQWKYTAFYDGKPHKVEGRDDVDSITIFKDGSNETGGWFTKDGVTVAGYRRAVEASALVVTAGGRRPDGTAYFDTIRYNA
ncbi:hypothetical protein NKH10_19755 [Mesorhizobium sp. M1340]|uniref:hypothetical protein n=1 Tax=unclassified Mesorhizobium TaxID=325217 RepID=UPI00333B2537